MEVWKEIKGYEKFYRISSMGNVWSLRNHRNLKPGYCGSHSEYKYVNLSDGVTISKKIIHRLVAAAFIPNPNNKPQVNHKNGVYQDNNVENLEWVTRRENILHAIHVIKTFPIGEKNHSSKLCIKSVIEIRVHFSSGLPMSQIARMYDVSPGTISDVIKNITWKHVA